MVPSRGNAGRTPPQAGTELAAARHAHVGVAVLGQHGNDLFELLAAADVALYRAKDAGRDQVRLYARAPGNAEAAGEGDDSADACP